MAYYASECRSQVEDIQRNGQTYREQKAAGQNKPALPQAGVREQRQTGANQDAAPNQGREDDPKPLLCDTRLTDILLVFFTYCLVIVGWATMRSNEDTVKRLERADITPLPGNITLRTIIAQAQVTPGNLPSRPSATIQLHNSGRTAATILNVRIGHIIAESLPDEPPFFGTASTPVLEQVVAGEAYSDSVDAWLDRMPTIADIDGVRSGQMAAFLYGAVNYTDIFGDDRETVWCLRSERDGTYRYWGGRKYNYRV